MDYRNYVDNLSDTANEFFQKKGGVFKQVLDLIIQQLRSGSKILIFGNGGSAAQAQHFAAELVNKFLKAREPLKAVSLTTDTSALTSIANDEDFAYVFSRQADALGDKGDVAIGLSTSGNSPNIIEAFKTAKKKGMVSVALTGRGGGSLTDSADWVLDVPSDHTPRIQEVHLILLHLMAEVIEDSLF